MIQGLLVEIPAVGGSTVTSQSGLKPVKELLGVYPSDGVPFDTLIP